MKVDSLKSAIFVDYKANVNCFILTNFTYGNFQVQIVIASIFFAWSFLLETLNSQNH